MPRPSTVLVIFVIAMNAFAFGFGQMGLYETIGLDTEITPDGDIPDDPGEVQGSDEYDLQTGTAADGTLFGMYNVLSSQVQGIFQTIFPALDMLGRAGVPSELLTVMGSVFGFVIVFDVMSYIRGWGL